MSENPASSSNHPSWPPGAGEKPGLAVFDVGNVLLQLRPWTEVFPTEAIPPGADLGELIRRLRSSDVYQRFERGRATVIEFCDTVRDVFSTSRSDSEIQDRYLRLLGPPMPGMEALLRELRARGVRLGGLSDTTPIHASALSAYPTVRLLDRLVTSCETGELKPDPEAFLQALRLLDGEPETTFFVDDIPENVAGARAVGMSGAVFTGATDLAHTLGLRL